MASRWPALALGRLDLAGIIPSITSFFKDRKEKSRLTISDGLILRIHYSWTLMVMMGAFTTVFYGWWSNEDEDGTKVDQIICASHFSATEMVSQRNYINYCLSYSFVDDKSRPNGKRYLLFYRWIQWTLLLLAALYYIPRKVANACENHKVGNLLATLDNKDKIGEGQFKKSIAKEQHHLIIGKAEKKNDLEEKMNKKRITDEVEFANELIQKMEIREDKQCSELKTAKVKELLSDIAKINKENVKEEIEANAHSEKEEQEKIFNLAQAADYFIRKSHKALFWKYIAAHLSALGVDFIALEILNFLLQGRFLTYGLYAYVWRDPDTFKDYISQTFPPFAQCELSEENQLVAKRTEKLGCHLTLMELYEKVFVFLWFWLFIVTAITMVYIIGIFIIFFTPFARRYFFYVKHPDYTNARELKNKIKEVYLTCDYGHLFLLFQIRRMLTNIQMFELLMIIQDPGYLLEVRDDHSDTTEELVPNYNSGSENPDWNSRSSSLDIPKYMMDANSHKTKINH